MRKGLRQGVGVEESLRTRECVPLEAVLTTVELGRRPSRDPDYEAENRALVSLMKEMATSPRSVLEKLVEATLILCRAHSAGVSLLEENEGRTIFRWHAVAGQWSRYIGGTMWREDSPCGTVLDRNASLLFSHPEQHFPFPLSVTPDAVEALLVPFHSGSDEPIGTIWVIAHDQSRRFDAEDRRVMESLGKLASTAYQMVSSLDALKVKAQERGRAEEALRQAQAKLADRAGQLEQLVVMRTADLRASNEQLETFVHSLAHDLRTPLRTMIGFSQILVDEHASELDDLARQMLKRIQASSEFMDKLLFDLLGYARTAAVPLEIAPIETEKAWERALLRCKTQMGQMGANVQMDSRLPTVRADKATLELVLTNLLSNALKFVPPGVQPRVHLRAENRGNNERLWVTDNGIGISAEYHDRIFRVFERLNGSSHSGTGIGLSIVRKAVERMGGKVGVESEPGNGSRFWIELPKAI